MKLLRAIVYSNTYVAVVLGLLTTSSYFVVSGLTLKVYVILSVFFGSFMLYNFHRLYKIDFIPEDQLSVRHLWVLAHTKSMKILMALSLFVLLLLTPSYDADTIVALIPAAMISLGYTIPILPSDKGWRRFRDIPFTKPLIIAIVVSYLTFAFPVFEQFGMNSLFDLDVVFGFTERFLFLLVVTIPFDLRDQAGDQQAGIETIATEFGFSKAKRVVMIALLAWLVAVFFQSFYTNTFDLLFYSKLILASFVSLGIWKMNQQRGDLYYILVFEGSIILYALNYFFLKLVA